MENERPFYSFYTPEEIASLRLKLKESYEEARRVTRASGVRIHPRVAAIKAALCAEASPTGFFASLTPEQQERALSYRGEENHGDPKYALKTEAEKLAYQSGWNDGFDAAKGPGSGEFYAKNKKNLHPPKAPPSKRGTKIRLVCETDAPAKGR